MDTKVDQEAIETALANLTAAGIVFDEVEACGPGCQWCDLDLPEAA